MKRCSTSLVIREVQIRMAVKYNLIPSMMAVTKTQKVVSASENVKKLGLLYTVAGNEKGGHYGKQYGDSSEKLEIELPYDSAIPLLHAFLHARGLRSASWRDICTPMVFAVLVTVAKRWKCFKCSLTDEWRKKMGCTHTMKYQSVCDSVGAPWGHYTKPNKPVTEGPIMCNSTYMRCLK